MTGNPKLRSFLSILAFSICAEVHANEYYFDIEIGLNGSSEYRGLTLASEPSINMESLYSIRGFNFEFEIENSRDSQQIEGQFSYGYTFGHLDVFAGISYSAFKREFPHQSITELWFQVVGNEEWGGALPYGVVPSIFQAFSVDGSEKVYTELKLERVQEFPERDLLFNPYVNIALGQFYSNRYELNHMQTGFDVNWYVTDNLNFSVYASGTYPFRAIRNSFGDRDWHVEVGVNARYAL